MSAAVARNERVREATQRQIMGGFLNEQANEADASNSNKIVGSNCEHVSALLEDLKAQFNQRIEAMHAEAMDAKNTQQQVYASGMVKLSKNVKRMSVREFDALYKCSLVGIARNIRDEYSFAASKKRDRMAVETPTAVRRSSRNIMTPSRTVRRGEVLYSENGSPVDQADKGALVATVTKKRRGNNSSCEAGDDTTTAATNFEISVGDGKYISLTDPSNIGHLDQENKLQAFSQLKVLQDQVTKLMQDLSN